MLPRLEDFLRASPKSRSFQIIDNDPIDEANFLPKIRCELASGQVVQIRVRAVAGNIRYSYQECADKPLRRWTNAPIFPSPELSAQRSFLMATRSTCSADSRLTSAVADVFDDALWVVAFRGEQAPTAGGVPTSS